MATANTMSSSLMSSLAMPPVTELVDRTVNVLITTFAGLGLPCTLSLPLSASTPISDVIWAIRDRLPPIDRQLIITTTTNKQLLETNTDAVSTLLSCPTDSLLTLRLSARLCGGKGGFGSQLRAAGGRMSSRKNKQQQNANGSNRNLDGRRLRTVDEAKRLADYLAIKPDMDKREKEERKKRWEAVVAAAERKEEEIKSGKAGASQGRLSADYVEGKEKAEEAIREAVLKATREGMIGLERTGSESSSEAEEERSNDDERERRSSDSSETANQGGRSFFGWDDEDDEDEDEDEDEDTEDKGEDGGEGADKEAQCELDSTTDRSYEGKGKSKAA